MFFPDKRFRFLLYLIYPLIVWACLFLESIFFDGNIVLIITAAAVIIVIECLADFFVFAGYARKDICRNEYLKTSVKYIKLLRMAFLSDIIRRFLSILLIISVTSAVLKIPFNLALFIVISVNLFITAALFILRYFDFFAVYNFITVIIALLYLFFSTYILKDVYMLDKNIFNCASIAFFILGVMLMIFHIRILFKVVKEEYND